MHMRHDISPLEASAALEAIDRGRRRVIDEIDLPNWYWWGLALGWIGLGVITDLKHPWLTAAATLVFGAVHAAVAPRVASGRHRTQQLSVRAELAGRRMALIVVLAVAALGLVTVGLAFALHADGTRDPSIVASIIVAIVILLGGPRLVAAAQLREPAE